MLEKKYFKINAVVVSKNPEKKNHEFQKKKKKFHEQKIRALEWFLNDHVTLKTGVMHNDKSYWSR